MASNGIRDQICIIGMGCTPFGEHWDKSVDDMLIDASTEALASAGMKIDDIDAFWLGTLGGGQLSGLTMSRPLKLDYKPVTRVENFCATGSEALRNACYAVASGAYDTSHGGIGVEKLKDSGLLGADRDPSAPPTTAPCRALTDLAGQLLLPGPVVCGTSTAWTTQEMKDVMTRIAWKNHFGTGHATPGPSSARRSPSRPSRKAPRVAGELGVFDCSGGVRRIGGGHRVPGRGRPPLHRQPRCM